MSHSPLAIVTGAASGIGLAAVKYLLGRSIRVVMIDKQPSVHEVAQRLRQESEDDKNVMAYTVDVSRRGEVVDLQRSLTILGPVSILLNNAGIMRTTPALPTSISPDDLHENWDQVFQVNIAGVVNMCQVFGPAMAAHKGRSRIINTGSKQGITCPPGNAGYNVSKAAVKVYTEQLSYELRAHYGDQCTAHLFIPGWVWTPMNGETSEMEQPKGCWTASQTIEYAFGKIFDKDDFYVICPDAETSTALDLARIEWSVGDVLRGRPALSRWHSDYKQEFDAFMMSRTS